MNRHLSIAVSGAVIAVAIVLPIVLFGVARALNADEVAPNVSAGGVELGGLSREDALEAMRAHENALRETPAHFTVKGEEFELDPRIVGLRVDEEAIVDTALQARRAGGFLDQFAAWTRSFRTPIVIAVPITTDEVSVNAVLTSWENTAIGNPAQEGGFEVVDAEVVPDYPKAGEGIDRVPAEAIVHENLATLERPEAALPTSELVPRVTDADVDEAVAIAERLIGAPITLTADDPEVVVEFSQEALAAAVRSRVIDGPPAEIVVEFDPDALAPVLEPERANIESPARNAEFVLAAGVVSVEPSRRQTLLDASLVATTLREVGMGPDVGVYPFRFGDEANFTTEEAEAMEPIEQVSAFTTSHPAGQPRVTNIHLFADAVDGAVVWPGESFSLNDRVGERTEEKGYLPAPMILRGEIVDAVGGGVSQFATTFYNAVFYGCYEDVTHQPHSFYFDRYPEGNEATISWTQPDLVFRNNTDAVVIIDTSYSDTDITVRFYGNNGGFDCDAERSERYNPTEPQTQYDSNSSVPPGAARTIQSGSPGWTIDVTRIKTAPDGATSEQVWTVRYQPRPEIIEAHPCDVPGSGVPCPVRVPSVIGLSFDAAAAQLASAGFKIADGGTTSVGSAGQDGLVQSQSPAGGTYAGGGSVVSVVTGSYTAPPTTVPPDTTTPPPDTTTPPDTTKPPKDGE